MSPGLQLEDAEHHDHGETNQAHAAQCKLRLHRGPDDRSEKSTSTDQCCERTYDIANRGEVLCVTRTIGHRGEV